MLSASQNGEGEHVNWGISTIGTQNRDKHYYINKTNLFQRWNPCFIVKQLPGNLKSIQEYYLEQ